MKYDCVWYTFENGQAALDLLERLPLDERRARNKKFGIAMKYDGVPIPNASGTPCGVGHFMVRAFLGSSNVTHIESTGIGIRPDGSKFVPGTMVMDLEVISNDEKGMPTLVAGRLKPGVLDEFMKSPRAKEEREHEKLKDANRPPPRLMQLEWRHRWRGICLRKYGYQASEDPRGDEDFIISLAQQGAELPSWDEFKGLLEADWRASLKPYDPATFEAVPEPWNFQDVCDTYQNFRSEIVIEVQPQAKKK